MTEKKSRGQPEFEPTQDQRNQVKLMKALGIPEDRICKMITNPRTGKPVAPMTLARAFAAELESGATEFHALVGNFILCYEAAKVRFLCAFVSRLPTILRRGRHNGTADPCFPPGDALTPQSLPAETGQQPTPCDYAMSRRLRA